MLGLAYYDEEGTPASDASAAEEKEKIAGVSIAQADGPHINSIVDYGNDTPMTDASPQQRESVIGEDIDAHREATEKAATPDAESSENVPETSTEEKRAQEDLSTYWTMPPSPEHDAPSQQREKVQKLFQKVSEGYSVNEHIRKAKNFRNPDILSKLVDYFAIDEIGSNYPPHDFDPHGFDKSMFFEALEDQRRSSGSSSRKDKNRTQEKPAPKPAPAPVAVSSAAAAAAAAAKKSKWDKAGPSKQPVALPSQSALGTGIGSAKK